MNAPSKPVNALWSRAQAGRVVTMAHTPLVSKSTRVFIMGSCFAMEIRRQLQASGYRSLPDFSAVSIDRAHQFGGGIPDNERFVCYDTFTIRQEFDKAFGLWSQPDDPYWRVSGRPINASMNWPVVFQDPHRKLCFADSLEGIEDARQILQFFFAASGDSAAEAALPAVCAATELSARPTGIRSWC